MNKLWLSIAEREGIAFDARRHHYHRAYQIRALAAERTINDPYQNEVEIVPVAHRIDSCQPSSHFRISNLPSSIRVTLPANT
jgi:hypothetical protein